HRKQRWPGCDSGADPRGSTDRSRCRFLSGSADLGFSPAGSSGGPTTTVFKCTCGRSTTPRRCIDSSISGSTGSSPIAPTCSRACSSIAGSGLRERSKPGASSEKVKDSEQHRMGERESERFEPLRTLGEVIRELADEPGGFSQIPTVEPQVAAQVDSEGDE